MKFLRNMSAAVLALALAAGAMAEPSFAQVPSVQSVAPAQLRTYRTAFIGVTPAAGATDIMTLALGTASQVQLRQVHCDGITNSGTQAVQLQIIKRSSLDTGGTAVTPTSVQLNSLQPNSQANVRYYTANPTVGTLVSPLATGFLNTTLVGSPTFNNTGVTFDFTNQYMMINTTAHQIALNANAPTWNNGTQISCSMEWSEQ